MFVKLWAKRSTLGDDMLDKWVTVCRMKLFFHFFQCSLLDMPRMSLSHHNTLYLKQLLQKATRFIPLRQLELPIGLWNVVVYYVYCRNVDRSAVHIAASCEWCGSFFVCPWCSCKGSIGCNVKLWGKRSTLGDDMLDKWVTVCRMKLFFHFFNVPC